MINRSYFASYKKYHDDGMMSFSWMHTTFTRKSWLSESHKAFADQLRSAKEAMSDKPGGYSNVHCITFNRI